jgi:hypothetical protein
MTDASGRTPTASGSLNRWGPTLHARGWVQGVMLSQTHLGEGQVLLTRDWIEFGSDTPFPLRIPYANVEGIRGWELTEYLKEAHPRALTQVHDSGHVVAGSASDEHGIQGGFTFIVIPVGGSDVNQWLAELGRRCRFASVYPSVEGNR